MKKLHWTTLAAVMLAVACQDRTITPGTVPGADAEASDGQTSAKDSGESNDDSGANSDDSAVDSGAAIDSGLPLDSGIAVDTGGAYDAGIDLDTGLAIDTGVNDRDAGSNLPDFGFGGFDFGGGLFDGTFPSFDGSFPRFDGGVVQTEVTLPNGANVWLNLQPPVDPDPIRFNAELTFDNTGTMPETITVTSARIFSAIPFFSQDFQVEPPHTAPPGISTKMVQKVPGSGSANPMNAMGLCNSMALLTLELSNGRRVADLVTMTCVM